MSSVPNLRHERKFSAKMMDTSHDLLTVIEQGSVDDVRSLLSNIPEGITSALNTPSLLMKHNLRTPLMAAAATGEAAKWSAVLNAFDRQFTNKLRRDVEMRMQLANRDRFGMTVAMLGVKSGNVAIVVSIMEEIEQTEAKTSLEAHDYTRRSLLMHAAGVSPASIFQEVNRALRSMNKSGEEFALQLVSESDDDKTILMLAALSGDAMTLKAVATACRKTLEPQKVRELLRQRDSDGMSFLMHAVSCRNTSSPSVGVLPTTGGDADKGDQTDGSDSTTVANGDGGDVEQANFAGDDSSDVPGVEKALVADEKPKTGTKAVAPVPKAAVAPAPKAAGAAAIPMLQVAINLVRDCLWKDQVVEELVATDLWGRSILTHAVLSGNEALFEAALASLRNDVFDEQVNEMLETTEGQREDAPMIAAVEKADTSMKKLFALRASQLQKDVDARSKLQAIDAKIESFIPGKLIVLFQLLLPQIAEARQLRLLLAMCALAPLLSFGVDVATNTSSKYSRITARTGKLSLLLGAPAMFFWGIGTSNVGQTSALGWSASLSATAMAAATICIPAIDSFFNSASAAHWCDKITCDEWRFNFKAWHRWRRERNAKAAEPRVLGATSDLSSYSTFMASPEFSLQTVEEAKELLPAGTYASRNADVGPIA